MRKYNLRLGFDQLDRRMNIGCIAARSCGEERGGGGGASEFRGSRRVCFKGSVGWWCVCQHCAK